MNFGAFLDTLPIMGKGMLGIFIVTLVIIGVIWLLGNVPSMDKNPSGEKGDK